MEPVDPMNANFPTEDTDMHSLKLAFLAKYQNAQRRIDRNKHKLESSRLRSTRLYICATVLVLVIILLLSVFAYFMIVFKYRTFDARVGIAYLATKEGKIMGHVQLYQEENGLRIVGTVNHLKANSKHGFYISNFSDIVNGHGNHFDPEGKRHGCPLITSEYKAGDLGNLETDANGIAFYDWKNPKLTLGSVIGRSLVVEEEADACSFEFDDGKQHRTVLAQGSIGRPNDLSSFRMKKSTLSAVGKTENIGESPTWGSGGRVPVKNNRDSTANEIVSDIERNDDEKENGEKMYVLFFF